jgi:hypothetical protein
LSGRAFGKCESGETGSDDKKIESHGGLIMRRPVLERHRRVNRIACGLTGLPLMNKPHSAFVQGCGREIAVPKSGKVFQIPRDVFEGAYSSCTPTQRLTETYGCHDEARHIDTLLCGE